jgi:hypothetical protein
MAIESVSSAAVSTALNTPLQPRQPAEDRNQVQARPPEPPREAERAQTNQAVQPAAESEAPRPTVNTTGQTVGRIVNTTA